MTVRSMSSLSETLHQSFWQYILPHPLFMVTVEEYGFVLLLLTLCVPLQMYSTLMHPDGSALGVQNYSAFRAAGIAVGLAFFSFFTLQWLEGKTGGDGEVSIRTLTEWWIVSMLCVYAMGLSGMLLCARVEETQTRGGGGQVGDDVKDDAVKDTVDEGASHAWRGLKFMLLVPFYALHCFVLGIRNYPFAYFANLIMIPVVCGTFPYFGTRAGGSRCAGWCRALTCGSHAMLLLASSPPAIVFFWVPAVASMMDPDLVLPGGVSGGSLDSAASIAIPAEVSAVWSRVFRNWSEMGTFHAPYFSAFYIPVHIVASHITLMASRTPQ